MKRTNYLVVTSLLILALGFVLSKSMVGSVCVMLSVVLFAYWEYLVLKNRMLAMILLIIVIAILWSVLPLFRA